VLPLIENYKNRSAKNASPNMKLLGRKKRRREKRSKRNKRRPRSSPRNKQRPRQRKTRKKKRRRRGQSEGDPRDADLPHIPHLLHHHVRVHEAERRPVEGDLGGLDPTLLPVEAATAAIHLAAARIRQIPTLLTLRTALGRTVVILLPGLGAEAGPERIAGTERDR